MHLDIEAPFEEGEEVIAVTNLALLLTNYGRSWVYNVDKQTLTMVCDVRRPIGEAVH